MKLSGVVKLTKNIFKGTAIIEGIGALLLATRFVPELGFLQESIMRFFIQYPHFAMQGLIYLEDLNNILH